MDKLGADFDNCVRMIIDRVGGKPVCLQMPIGSESNFRGVIDLIRMRALVWEEEGLGARFHDEEIPADLLEKAKELRHSLVEHCVECDDEAMAAYLDGHEPDEATLRRLVRLGVQKRMMHPVFCGSAFKNKGVQPLLDAVVDYLPSPLDRGDIPGLVPDTEESIIRHPSDEEPLSLLAFKIMDDQFVGSITFCRIYSGQIKSGMSLLNATRDKKERVGRMLLMHANNREDIKEAYAGDIVAIAGLSDVRTGDTLCDIQRPILLEKIESPDPVIELLLSQNLRLSKSAWVLLFLS
jgi:elongation factor G